MAKRKPTTGQLGLGFGMTKAKAARKAPAKKKAAKGSALVKVSGYSVKAHTRRPPRRRR